MAFSKPSQLSAALLFLLSLPVFLLSLTVHADDKDPLNVIVGVSEQHDNNIFRVPSGMALSSGLERWDNITTTYAGVRVDKQYSMQRLKFDFTLTAYRYQNNGFLDFEAKDYNAAWLWSLTPSLTGTLSADRRQQLIAFQDNRNFSVANISTTENQHFEADFSPHGSWHLLGGFTRSSQTNSQTFNPQPSFSMNSLDAGLKYVFPSGTAITLMGHDRRGDYGRSAPDPVSLLDTAFDETEEEAKLDWLISAKSRINLRAAYVTHEEDHFSQRDYSGTVGRMEYNWMPTGKLQVAVAASSELSSYQTDDSSYTRYDTLSVSPTYAVSNKVTMRASASVSERTFLGKGVIPSSDRVDTEKLASVGIYWSPLRSIDIYWSPLRNVSIGGNLQRSSRSSTSPGLDFSDTTAGITANLYF